MELMNYDDFVVFFANITSANLKEIWNNNNFTDLGVDSLTLMNLIVHIESKYTIKLSPGELSEIKTPLKLFNLLVNKKKKQTKNKDYPLYGYNKLETVVDLLEYADRTYYNEYAFVYRDDKHNYIKKKFCEFKTDVLEFSTSLFNNLGSANKIVLIGKNSYGWIKAYFSIIQSGNIAVLLDPELCANDILTIINKSNSNIILIDYKDETIRKIEKDISSQYVGLILKYNTNEEVYIENKYKSKMDISKIDKNDIATIIYTSGTTGFSKGVILSHYNLISDMISFCRLIEYGKSSILCLPLHHTFGLVIILFSSIYYGQSLYISEGINYLFDEISYVQPSNLGLVPMLIEILCEEVKKSLYEDNINYLSKDISAIQRLFLKPFKQIFKNRISENTNKVFGHNLQFIISGGAPLHYNSSIFLQNLEIEVINGYGTTECSPCISVNRAGANVFGSVGQILPCNEVLIDNSNNINSSEGEILVKGTNVMKGYFNDTINTEKAISKGYYRTGDIGKIENGVLYITGRCKNMILLKNGLNVFPEEIESIIKKIDYVNNVLVYAESDQIVADVFIEDISKRSLINDEVRRINNNLPQYKQIKKILIRENEFLITSTGKIKRENC